MHAIAAGKTAPNKSTARVRVRGGKGVATRSMGLLGAVFSYAIEQGLRPDNSNPVRGIRKFATGQRERRLSDDEYKQLGEALRQAEAEQRIWPPAVAATRFLTLTGWRSSEALGLRWQDVDMVRRTATLPDSKTGKSVRPLSNAACDVLRAMPRIGDTHLIFPPSRGPNRAKSPITTSSGAKPAIAQPSITRAGGLMSGFGLYFAKLAGLAGLAAGITPHVLRHTFASVAGDLGLSELSIGALLGHTGYSVTSRYVHAADAMLLLAADTVAGRVAELLGDSKPSADIIPIRRD